jgi:hypothetical protein
MSFAALLRVSCALLVLLGLSPPVQAAGLLINGDRTLAGRMNYCDATGGPVAYVCTLSPPITAYLPGQCFSFKAPIANSGAATLAVNGLAAKTIQKRIAGTLTTLTAGDIGTGQVVDVCYDGTILQAQSLGGGAGSGTVTQVNTSGAITGGPITSSGTLALNSATAGFLADGGVTNLTCGAAQIGKMQVMDNGEVQYCDGATTSVLQRGLPTQTGLTWNVTAGTCTGDTNSGKLTVNGSNQIICGIDNGGAGGGGTITTVGTCTTGVCFSDTTPSTRLTYSPIAAPATPGASKASVYVDSTSKNLAVKDDAGVVKHGVQTKTQTAGQYVVAVADDGTVTSAAPTKADVGLSNVDNTSDATKNSATAILTNKQHVPRVVLGTPSANVITPNADSTDILYNYTLAAGTTIANPTATGSNPVDQQRLEFTFKTAAPQTLSWGTAFNTECGLPLPTSTSGDGATYDHFLFRYSTTSAKWCLLAASKAPSRRVTTLSSATTYTCPAAVSDQCEMAMVGATGTVTMAAPTGSPSNGDLLMLGLLCTNAQTLTWNAIFVASPNVPLASSCPADTTRLSLYGLRYSSLISKWQLISTN